MTCPICGFPYHETKQWRDGEYKQCPRCRYCFGGKVPDEKRGISEEPMQIKFKKLCPEAVAPKQGTFGSAGFDLTAVSMNWLDSKTIKYETGIAVEIPPGFVGLLFPRSSCYKVGMMLTCCVGVIDSDYRGGISFIYRKNHREHNYHAGERIGQLVIVPTPWVEYVESDELSETSRGTGGYGSTGK